MRHSGVGILIPAIVAGLLLTGLHGAQANEGKSLGVGATVVAKPKYEGSDEHDVYVVPMIVPKFSDSSDGEPSTFKKLRQRVKIRNLDDIRVRVLERGNFEAGAVTGYITDRDQDDASRLLGLGDVDGGLVLGGYAGIRRGSVLFDAAVLDKITGDEAGVQFRLGAEAKRQVSDRTKVTARIGTTFASDDYMQTYFGVTPAQAATSAAGLPAFNANGGIKDIHLDLGTEILLGERWVLRAGGRYGRLLGDAADSPVIETENQISGKLGLAYRFHFTR